MNNEEKKTYEENLVNLQEDIQKDAEEVKQVCIYQKEKRIAENALRLEESWWAFSKEKAELIARLFRL